MPDHNKLETSSVFDLSLESLGDSAATKSKHKYDRETGEEDDSEVVSVRGQLNRFYDFGESFHGGDARRQLPHLFPLFQLLLAVFRQMRSDTAVFKRRQDARHLKGKERRSMGESGMRRRKQGEREKASEHSLILSNTGYISPVPFPFHLLSISSRDVGAVMSEVPGASLMQDRIHLDVDFGLL